MLHPCPRLLVAVAPPACRWSSCRRGSSRLAACSAAAVRRPAGSAFPCCRNLADGSFDFWRRGEGRERGGRGAVSDGVLIEYGVRHQNPRKLRTSKKNASITCRSLACVPRAYRVLCMLWHIVILHSLFVCDVRAIVHQHETISRLVPSRLPSKRGGEKNEKTRVVRKACRCARNVAYPCCLCLPQARSSRRGAKAPLLL